MHTNMVHYFLVYISMSSTTQMFSETYPKRSDVVGSCVQAFGCGTVLLSTIVNSIKVGTVAAVGIVSGSLETMFIYNPQVHTKLDGTPVSILGNASNVIGEFTLVSLSLLPFTLRFGYFNCVFTFYIY